MAENPFAVLSFIAGPALLTNASSVLLLGTINRHGRALDRVRSLAAMLSNPDGNPDREHEPLFLEQLRAAERRVLIIVRSLTLFYVAVGSFGLGTLSFLVGDVILSPFGWAGAASIVMVTTTMIGALCLIGGTALLAWESRLSYRILRREAEFARYLTARRHQG
jgi:hypothetical protein